MATDEFELWADEDKDEDRAEELARDELTPAPFDGLFPPPPLPQLANNEARTQGSKHFPNDE
ncbi:MAG: hypothetical protein B0W54_10790 [Cellvibrio sp. 79]|nr:MAG: hypothetical protein B0W54_10790 [Cellvibrio sp. 79]